jgi:hypothetical protein
MRRIVAGISTLEEHLETVPAEARRSTDRRRARTAGSSSCVSTGTTTGRPIGECSGPRSTRCRSAVTAVAVAGAPVRACPSASPHGVGTPGRCNSNALSARVGGRPAGGECSDDGQPAVRSTGRWWALAPGSRTALRVFICGARFRELGRASDFCGVLAPGVRHARPAASHGLGGPGDERPMIGCSPNGGRQWGPRPGGAPTHFATVIDAAIAL